MVPHFFWIIDLHKIEKYSNVRVKPDNDILYNFISNQIKKISCAELLHESALILYSKLVEIHARSAKFSFVSFFIIIIAKIYRYLVTYKIRIRK